MQRSAAPGLPQNLTPNHSLSKARPAFLLMAENLCHRRSRLVKPIHVDGRLLVDRPLLPCQRARRTAKGVEVVHLTRFRQGRLPRMQSRRGASRTKGQRTPFRLPALLRGALRNRLAMRPPPHPIPGGPPFPYIPALRCCCRYGRGFCRIRALAPYAVGRLSRFRRLVIAGFSL